MNWGGGGWRYTYRLAIFPRRGSKRPLMALNEESRKEAQTFVLRARIGKLGTSTLPLLCLEESPMVRLPDSELQQRIGPVLAGLLRLGADDDWPARKSEQVCVVDGRIWRFLAYVVDGFARGGIVWINEYTIIDHLGTFRRAV